MRKQTLILGAFSVPLCLALAACGSSESSDPATEETSEAEAPGEAASVTADEGSTDGASQESAMASSAAPKDFIRSKGGLEDKCIAKVNEMTGGNAIGTNRIEESEAAIGIYVNVQGAEAPWRCLGYKDGTIGEVMYTGDEGAL